MDTSEIEDFRAFKLDAEERMWRKMYANGLTTKARLTRVLALIEESRQAKTCHCPIEPDDPNHDIDDCFDAAVAAYQQDKQEAESRRKQSDIIEANRSQRAFSA